MNRDVVNWNKKEKNKEDGEKEKWLQKIKLFADRTNVCEPKTTIKGGAGELSTGSGLKTGIRLAAVCQLDFAALSVPDSQKVQEKSKAGGIS